MTFTKKHKRSLLSFLCILCFFVAAYGQPSVTKVDPPSWWAKHSINPVRLLVRGSNLRGAHVRSLNPELRASGVSLLYTTHYMEEAERLCDRIAIIDHGRIIASGTKDELVRQTVGGRQTLTVEAESALPAALAAELSRRGGQVDGASARLPVQAAGDEIRGVLETFHAANVPVRNLTLQSPSLEQVFLQLTGRELRE